MLLEGELDFYAGDGWDVFPTIAGKNIYAEIEAAFPDALDRDPYEPEGPKLRIMLGADPIATGTGYGYTGWVGTDVTPGDPAELRVGNVDVLEKLREFDGRTVALSVELADG